jgi:hypothetical protein
MTTQFANPFRPGAGHLPPHLAGRTAEIQEFLRLLEQNPVLKNPVLTGLRGVGKTVLLETLKPKTLERDWLWIGTDLSESASLKEENIAVRLLTDLSVITSSIVIDVETNQGIGFSASTVLSAKTLSYQGLVAMFESAPGLVADKLKAVLVTVWQLLKSQRPTIRGIVFAYDEAQNLSDHAAKEQFPLSMLLDVFQSIQRQGVSFLLALTGLPTLPLKLVEARTYTERMFSITFLKRLNDVESRAAITEPVKASNCPIRFDEPSIESIVRLSGGYPYFIQFICREVYDVFISKISNGQKASVPVDEITRKLDTDFFSGRWAKATDRQRELLYAIAQLSNHDGEFSVQEIVDVAKTVSTQKPFGSSQVNQLLAKLGDVGLVFKNRHGRYSFAVPLLGQFIRRQALTTQRPNA